MHSRTVTVEGVAGQCPACHHPPIRHVQDGTGYTCVVCAFMLEEALVQALRGNVVKIERVCTLKFEFKLSQHEREQAMVADKGACLLYTSPSPRDSTSSRMPSSA